MKKKTTILECKCKIIQYKKGNQKIIPHCKEHKKIIEQPVPFNMLMGKWK